MLMATDKSGISFILILWYYFDISGALARR